MPSSVVIVFVSAPSDTDPQIGSDGATDVAVGVFVGVKLGVGVRVAVGVFVRVGVSVNVLVGPGVRVGLGFVSVAVSVGFFEGVVLGSTTGV